MLTEASVKNLELLKQAVPGLGRIAVIFAPATPSHGPVLKGVEAAGPLLAMILQPVAVRSATEFESAFLAIVQGRADAVLVLTTPLFVAGAQPLAEVALTHKLPSVFTPRENVDAGDLISYSPNRADYYRRGAIYVDQILKGANPADLPVQQQTRSSSSSISRPPRRSGYRFCRVSTR